MRKALLRLAISSLALAAAPVAAQLVPAPPPDAGTSSSDVTVHGPERMICRAVVRTATRMRAGRVCRPVSQWVAENNARSQDEVLDDAANTLDGLRADDESTGCQGGMSRAYKTPLGPR